MKAKFFTGEFLTVEEQKKLEVRQNMAIGFWIGWSTMLLCFLFLIFIK